jgi:small-conductance mechanosensitive channel
MGDYDYYKIKRNELAEKIEEKNIVKIDIEEEKHKQKKVKPINDTKKKEIALKSLEKKIYKLEQEIAEINTRVNSLGSDYIELSKCTSQREKIEKELEELIEEWIEVSS